MITLLGLLGNIAVLCVYLVYDTSMKEVLPVWLNLLMVASMFVYQTFDAIDGKQARRTGTSGPLGQLFDHGCDAVTTSVCLALLGQSLLLGSADDGDLSGFFYFYLASHVTFYLAQWEEQHTHVLRSNIFGLFGVTEGKSLKRI